MSVPSQLDASVAKAASRERYLLSALGESRLHQRSLVSRVVLDFEVTTFD